VATADGSPVAPARVLTKPLPEANSILETDIGAIKAQAGLVIVALHKGTVHTPAVVENYERELARLAVDAGADIVIGHHAHIIRGIEFIQGKPVFHGLGNGCVVTRALSPNQAHKGRADWARKRKILFGFEPDPAYELAPFHPEAVHAFMTRIVWTADGRLEAGIVPVFVDPPGRPRLAEPGEADSICDYLEAITVRANLGTLTLTKSSDMVHVT
jgi:poly-gamma-glutamate synthesis protein (capsule biosynthesis protein)